MSSICDSMFMNFGDNSGDNKNMVEDNSEEEVVDSGTMSVITDTYLHR